MSHFCHVKRTCWLSVSAAFILIFGCIQAAAQTTNIILTEYAAKYTCGIPTPRNPFGLGDAVRPADYATTINIHNPGIIFGGIADPPVVFLKKVVISSPEGFPPKPPSPFRQDILEADFSEEVDCDIIYAMTGVTRGVFIEGYVVLYALPSPALGTPSELDVTDVITATPLLFPTIGITTEIQTISPRFIHH